MTVAEIAQLVQVICQPVAVPDPKIAVGKRSIELIPVPAVFRKIVFGPIEIGPHARKEHLGGSKIARSAFAISPVTVIGLRRGLRRRYEIKTEAEGC